VPLRPAQNLATFKIEYPQDRMSLVGPPLCCVFGGLCKRRGYFTLSVTFAGTETLPLVAIMVIVLTPVGVPPPPEPPEEAPVPLRVIICGVFAALSAIVSVPVCVPVAVGSNVT
jgi:hypothetical protein